MKGFQSAARTFPMMKNAADFKAVRLSFLLIAICLVAAAWQLSQPNGISDPSKVVTSAAKMASLSDAALSQGASRITGSKTRSPLPHEELVLFEKKLQTNYSVVWMSPMEVNLVLRYMHGVKNYFEWGSGGSTFNFPQFASDSSVSVEHNEEWCQHVRETIAENESLQKLAYYCIPVPRGHMGWGVKNAFEEGTYPIFKKYIDQIDRAGHQRYDLILIDGRARVDAAIKALSYQDQQSVVVLHDAARIWDRRYKEVLKYYSVKDTCGGDDRQGIAILKRKPEFRKLEKNHTAVQEILNEKYGL